MKIKCDFSFRFTGIYNKPNTSLINTRTHSHTVHTDFKVLPWPHLPPWIQTLTHLYASVCGHSFLILLPMLNGQPGRSKRLFWKARIRPIMHLRTDVRGNINKQVVPVVICVMWLSFKRWMSNQQSNKGLKTYIANNHPPFFSVYINSCSFR